MEIHDPVDVAAMAAKLPRRALAVACIAGAAPLTAVIRLMIKRLKTSSGIVLAVGPEGDFTDAEMAVMKEAGFIMAGLGNNRLRSETAALAALSIATAIIAELDASGPKWSRIDA